MKRDLYSKCQKFCPVCCRTPRDSCGSSPATRGISENPGFPLPRERRGCLTDIILGVCYKRLPPSTGMRLQVSLLRELVMNGRPLPQFSTDLQIDSAIPVPDPVMHRVVLRCGFDCFNDSRSNVVFYITPWSPVTDELATLVSRPDPYILKTALVQY